MNDFNFFFFIDGQVRDCIAIRRGALGRRVQGPLLAVVIPARRSLLELIWARIQDFILNDRVVPVQRLKVFASFSESFIIELSTIASFFWILIVNHPVRAGLRGVEGLL